MRKNLLAMICNEHGNVADRKYVSTLAEALKWAQNFSELGNYEIVVFKTTIYQYMGFHDEGGKSIVWRC